MSQLSLIFGPRCVAWVPLQVAVACLRLCCCSWCLHRLAHRRALSQLATDSHTSLPSSIGSSHATQRSGRMTLDLACLDSRPCPSTWPGVRPWPDACPASGYKSWYCNLLLLAAHKSKSNHLSSKAKREVYAHDLTKSAPYVNDAYNLDSGVVNLQEANLHASKASWLVKHHAYWVNNQEAFMKMLKLPEICCLIRMPKQ